MALSFIQEDLEIPTALFNFGYIRLPRVSRLRVCCHPRLYFLPCLPQIFRKTPRQNDNLCFTSSIAIFRHKSRRANIEQIFQRHRLHWRGSAEDLSLGCADDYVRDHSSTIAFLYQLLAVSCLLSRIHHLSLSGVLLLENFTWIEEIRVHLSQSCFLSLLGDHGWTGHHSNTEKGKRFHRTVIPVSLARVGFIWMSLFWGPLVYQF